MSCIQVGGYSTMRVPSRCAFRTQQVAKFFVPDLVGSVAVADKSDLPLVVRANPPDISIKKEAAIRVFFSGVHKGVFPEAVWKCQF